MNNANEFAATNTTAHLTEDQFSDYLLGLSTEAMDLHIEQCEACRNDVLKVQDAVGMFAEAGREWSTLQPVSMPSAEAARSIRRRSMWMSLRPVAGFAAAAVAVFGITFTTHRAPAAAGPVAVASTHDAPIIASESHTAQISREKPATLPRVSSSTVAALEPGSEIAGTVQPMEVVSAPVAPRMRGASEAEVAQDNALMAAIDAEISAPYSVPSDVSRPFNGQ